jgi:hypothetical protein
MPWKPFELFDGLGKTLPHRARGYIATSPYFRWLLSGLSIVACKITATTPIDAFHPLSSPFLSAEYSPSTTIFIFLSPAFPPKY